MIFAREWMKCGFFWEKFKKDMIIISRFFKKSSRITFSYSGRSRIHPNGIWNCANNERSGIK